MKSMHSAIKKMKNIKEGSRLIDIYPAMNNNCRDCQYIHSYNETNFSASSHLKRVIRHHMSMYYITNI